MDILNIVDAKLISGFLYLFAFLLTCFSLVRHYWCQSSFNLNSPHKITSLEMFESHLQQPLMLSLSEEANWGEFKLESFLCVVGCVALSLQPPWLSSPNHFCLHRCCSYKIKWHGAHARFPLCCCNFHHNEPVKSYCIKLGSNREEEGVIWIPVGHQPLVLIFFFPLLLCQFFLVQRRVGALGTTLYTAVPFPHWLN